MNMVNLTTSSNVAPIPPNASLRFSNTCTAWAWMFPSPTTLPCASTATWPLMKATLPPVATVTCVYMPRGFIPGGFTNFFVIFLSSRKPVCRCLSVYDGNGFDLYQQFRNGQSGNTDQRERRRIQERPPHHLVGPGPVRGPVTDVIIHDPGHVFPTPPPR